MGLLNLLKKNKKENQEFNEISNILKLASFLDEITLEKGYIPRSSYINILQEFNATYEYFKTLKESETLKFFCKQHKLSFKDVLKTLDNYQNLTKNIDKHNNLFIKETLNKEKEYFDNILKDVDKNICLDDEQRTAIVTDEDNCLIIAGAGSGKTTTLAAKVKYLVEKKNIDPKKILLISFTNKAVNELKDKINKAMDIPCIIATFHATGNAILRKKSSNTLNIVDDTKMYFVLIDYFKNSILKNDSMVKQLILFFASYFDAPFNEEDLKTFFTQVAKGNYSTLKSDIETYQKEIIDQKSKKHISIQNEFLRSKQEVEIANFLYINGIDYEYEPIYPYKIEFSRKPYTPDFVIKQKDKIIYLEHFGLSDKGTSSLFDSYQLAKYKKAIHDKIRIHKEHGTSLIYTFSYYSDGRTLINHLEEALKKNGIEFNPRKSTEILEKIVSSEENRYIRKLIMLICRFISNFKANGYLLEEFDKMYSSTLNVRSKLFLNITKECYLEYQRYLNENNMVDFQDMINESTRILKNIENNHIFLDFEYIIVDEYQDISHQRFNLVEELSKVTKAKFIAVGDDWQSIYAFSGSDISLFTKFEECVGYAKQLKITSTYRNSQEIIDIAGNFIKRNPTQIQKELKSPKRISNPVIIYTYDATRKKIDDDRKEGANYNFAKATEIAIEQILAFNNLEKRSNEGPILILGRYGFDGLKLCLSGLFEPVDKNGKIRCVKHPKLNITYMTAHSSKGLTYDNVIIINCRNETYGFPSKIEDDPVLSFVIKEDHAIDFAEERRLFYVAMTRTKNRVYCVAPEQNPSEFLIELKKDYKNINLVGNWNTSNAIEKSIKHPCPICGFPMQFKYKVSYGLKLYICTNDPEVCGFMTNEYHSSLPVVKCDKCENGFLVAKKSKEASRYFLGCTNWKIDGTGCNNTISEYECKKLIKENYGNIKIKNVQIEKPVENKNNYLDLESSPLPKYVENSESKSSKTNINNNILFVPKTIIKALNEISEHKYYGLTMLANYLHGTKDEKIIKNEFDKKESFGKLSYLPIKNIVYLIHFLIDNDFIYVTNSNYPVLHPTSKANNLDNEMNNSFIKKFESFLKKENINSFENKGKAWSKEEEDKLIELFDNGSNISSIAFVLKRKNGGIRSRLKKLGKIKE